MSGSAPSRLGTGSDDRIRPGSTTTGRATVRRAGPEVGSEAADASAMSPRAGILGWFLFAVELAVAAVLGVLIWYAFSLLWELYPYVAAVAAPVVLAGVVLASQLLRRWRSQEPLGVSATAALLLVAAFLVVLPAAAVLAAG